VVGYYYDVTAGAVYHGSPPNPHALWCQPTQQYYNLPATGAVLTAFHTYVDLRQSNVCGGIRFALYEVAGGLYTLAAGTNSSSDVQVCPSTVGGPSLVSTTAPLYYPSASSSYTLFPGTSYALCFSNQGDQLTVPNSGQSGTIYQSYWKDALSSPSAVDLNYDFDQPLPNPFVSSSATSWAWQVWMTVTAPVITWSFVYGVQGQLSASSSTAFSVCTVGSVLTATMPVTSNGSSYAIYQMYGSRTYTNATATYTNHIMSLGPLNADGNDALLYPTTHPFIDSGGVTYAVDGLPYLPGATSVTPNTGSVLPYNNFLNIYNTSQGEVMEDGYDLASKGYAVPLGSRLWLSNASAAAVDCSVLTAPTPLSSSSSSSSSSFSSSSSSSSSTFSSSSSSSSARRVSISSVVVVSSSSTASSSSIFAIPVHSSTALFAYSTSAPWPIPFPCDLCTSSPSSSSSSSLPAPPVVVSPSDSDSSSDNLSLSGGALAGIIIGVFVGTVLLACLASLVLSSCLSNNKQQPQPHVSVPPPAYAVASAVPVSYHGGYGRSSVDDGGGGSGVEGVPREGYAPTIVEMGRPPWQR